MNRELRSAFRTFVMQFAPDTANSTTFGIQLGWRYGNVEIQRCQLHFSAACIARYQRQSVRRRKLLRDAEAVACCRYLEGRRQQACSSYRPRGPSEAWINAIQPSFTNWGEWDQTWSGVTSVTPRNELLHASGLDSTEPSVGSLTELSWNDVSTATTYQRQGTAYEFAVTQRLLLLATSSWTRRIIHNMRARDVVFSADGMKPNATSIRSSTGRTFSTTCNKPTFSSLRTKTVLQHTAVLRRTDCLRAKSPHGNVATNNGSSTLTGRQAHGSSNSSRDSLSASRRVSTRSTVTSTLIVSDTNAR
jgi:hypothetical protein